GEEDAVKVVGLALVPIGAGEEPGKARHRVRLVGLEAHADALIEPWTEQMVDDIEALLTVGKVHTADVDQAAEAAERILFEDGHDLNEIVARNLDGELAKCDLGAQELRSETVAQVAGKLVKGFVHQRSRIGRFSALDRAGPPDLFL